VVVWEGVLGGEGAGGGYVSRVRACGDGCTAGEESLVNQKVSGF